MLYIFRYDGTTYQSAWETATPSRFIVVEKIVDFDQDGTLEILVQELTSEDSSDRTYYCDVFEWDGLTTYRLQWRDLKINSYFNGLLDPAGNFDTGNVEVRFANNATKSYPFSIYVTGPIIYVDFTQINNGTGTLTNPFNTLAEAISTINNGGMIKIMAGTTSETFSGANAIKKKMTITTHNAVTTTIGTP